ncbi:hypothetical protein J2T08_005657 [Neorhizobium galegae]|uniref:hypothetical protein n=1 Tax=Neorhizobium galegae TaxID=399 RepID=UPI00278B8AEE|nr:hypothetical protein [Neorhizobium galegae]MDQ0137713.1 hypothetical protein [Neorhizobium galegae]
MLTRTAVFEGSIHEGKTEEFFALVETRLIPLWRQFPHAQNVRVLRPVKPDADAPDVALMLAIDFPSLAAIDEALASDTRTKARAATMEMLEMFTGRFYHIVFDRVDK